MGVGIGTYFKIKQVREHISKELVNIFINSILLFWVWQLASCDTIVARVEKSGAEWDQWLIYLKL